MAEIGLKPVGSATLVESLIPCARTSPHEALAVIGDEDVRKFGPRLPHRSITSAATCSFARAKRSTARSNAAAARQRLRAYPRAGKIEYALRTAAGRLNFDNAAARAIVAGLAAGPCRSATLSNSERPPRPPLPMRWSCPPPIRSGRWNRVRASVAPMNAVDFAPAGRPGRNCLRGSTMLASAPPVNDPVRLLLRGDTGGDVEYGKWRRASLPHTVSDRPSAADRRNGQRFFQ